MRLITIVLGESPIEPPTVYLGNVSPFEAAMVLSKAYDQVDLECPEPVVDRTSTTEWGVPS